MTWKEKAMARSKSIAALAATAAALLIMWRPGPFWWVFFGFYAIYMVAAIVVTLSERYGLVPDDHRDDRDRDE